jgi:hypothetical protein
MCMASTKTSRDLEIVAGRYCPRCDRSHARARSCFPAIQRFSARNEDMAEAMNGVRTLIRRGLRGPAPSAQAKAAHQPASPPPSRRHHRRRRQRDPARSEPSRCGGGLVGLAGRLATHRYGRRPLRRKASEACHRSDPRRSGSRLRRSYRAASDSKKVTSVVPRSRNRTRMTSNATLVASLQGGRGARVFRGP